MWNQKQFEEIYARYQSSGSRVKEFCRNEGIVTSRFFYWQRKLRKQGDVPGHPSGFVPIVFTGNSPQPVDNNLQRRQPEASAPPPTGEVYEIIYPDGVTLRVPRCIGLGQLRSLIFLTRQGHV